MGHAIAVMNTKGGVGKSTVVMALAETLSEFHNKNVLVIDSDSQTSISTMLMHVTRWEQLERQQKTLVDYLSKMVLGPGGEDWRHYIATGVSDLDDAQSIYLVPSHMELSLFEREISAQKLEGKLRETIRTLLSETKRMFDFIIIDCPPGLSVLTECWLRECDYFMPPTKPDYLAVRGLSILKRFRELSEETGFAKLLGVLINLKDGRISSEEDWHRKLAAEPENRLFQTAIPRRAYIQRAADFEPSKRTYIAKYPGDAGQSIKLVTAELIARIEGKPFEVPKPAPQPARPVATAAPPPQRTPQRTEPARPAIGADAPSTAQTAPAAGDAAISVAAAARPSLATPASQHATGAPVTPTPPASPAVVRPKAPPVEPSGPAQGAGVTPAAAAHTGAQTPSALRPVPPPGGSLSRAEPRTPPPVRPAEQRPAAADGPPQRRSPPPGRPTAPTAAPPAPAANGPGTAEDPLDLKSPVAPPSVARAAPAAASARATGEAPIDLTTRVGTAPPASLGAPVALPPSNDEEPLALGPAQNGHGNGTHTTTDEPARLGSLSRFRPQFGNLLGRRVDEPSRDGRDKE